MLIFRFNAYIQIRMYVYRRTISISDIYSANLFVVPRRPLFLGPVCTDILRCHSVLILRIYISKSKTDLGVNLNGNGNLRKFQH